MVVLLASWVPESSPFLTALALLLLTSTSSIGVWLVAVSSIALKIIWASLPADWTVANEALVTLVVAEMRIQVVVCVTN